MASSVLTIASVVSTRNFKGKTNAQVAELIDWFIADTAGPVPPELTTVAQRNQWKLDQAHDEMLSYVRQKAARNRKRMLEAERADLDAQVGTETDIV